MDNNDSKNNDIFDLPPLRQDLEIIKGPKTSDGFPTWSLYDPIRNLYFRIGWLEFELISNWFTTSQALIDSVNNKTTLNINSALIKNFIKFLHNNSLLELSPNNAAKELGSLADKIKIKRNFQLLYKYLFWNIRITKPDHFIGKTLPIFKPFFNKKFFILIFVLGIFSLYLVSRQWESYMHTFRYFFNLEGLFYFFLALVITKIIHELSHAYTAKYYGVHVNSMGISIIVFWPILFTDTTDAWRLTSRYQRMAIDAAGIIVELIIAVIATLLWSFLDDGHLRSILFFLATTSWFLSVFINLNPFIRFDGYYLLADFLEVPNLQFYSEVLGKWRLRKFLLGIKESKPIFFNKKKENIILTYSYCRWLYRIFLYIVIAIIVYHIFFKTLALVLMFLAIFLFLVYPVLKELYQYWIRLHLIKLNINLMVSLFFLIGFLVLLIIPWHISVNAPSILFFGQETKLYAPKASVVKNLYVKENQFVNKGDKLFVLSSPMLNYELEDSGEDLSLISDRIRAEAFRSQELGYQQATLKDLMGAESEYKFLKDQQDQLDFKAPFSGEVTYVAYGLKSGRWVGKSDYLLEIVNNRTNYIEAFVQEKDLNRIKVGDVAKFYYGEPGYKPLPLKILKIEKNATQQLDKPYLASIYGGDLPVQLSKSQQLTINDSRFRVILIATKKIPDYKHIIAGEVNIKGESKSILYRCFVKIYSVLIKESGF